MTQPEITDEDAAVSTFSFWPVFGIGIKNLQDIPSSLSSTCCLLANDSMLIPQTFIMNTMHFKPANSEPCCGRVQPHRAFHFITSCSLSAVRLLQTIWWVDYYKLMLCRQKLFKPRAWLLILDWRPKFPRIPNMFVWITGEGPHNDAGDV